MTRACRKHALIAHALFAWEAFHGIAAAQTITFSPPMPASDTPVTVTLTEPFDCAPQPLLVARVDGAFRFQSTLTDGVVQCPFIPFPPPNRTSFDETLGLLPAGTYAVTWDVYLKHVADGSTALVSSTSATLTVAAGALAISPGFTGNWYDPDASGHGFSIEVLPGNVLLAEWFVFAPDGGQAWFTASGPITGNHAVLQAYFPDGAGGRFPPNFDAARLQAQFWGTITFAFDDCNSGTVSWSPTATGYASGALPIRRLTLPAGLSCP
jgi:hypothetical protein